MQWMLAPRKAGLYCGCSFVEYRKAKAMEEIEQRLKESTDAFIKSFENWVKQGKNLESRESLMEAMHEVRKVVSRVEIEIAISERDRLGSRPIPIPSHRSQRRTNNDSVDIDDVNFNAMEDNDEGVEDLSGNGEQKQPRRGGGGSDRRPRRPMNRPAEFPGR